MCFQDCGTITNCKWLEDRDTGKFKGCGFITFSSPEEATKAVAMNGTEILGRPCKVDYSVGKPARTPGAGGGGEVRPMQAKPDGCTTLFCGNLSFDIDDDGIKNFFKVRQLLLASAFLCTFRLSICASAPLQITQCKINNHSDLRKSYVCRTAARCRRSGG